MWWNGTPGTLPAAMSDRSPMKSPWLQAIVPDSERQLFATSVCPQHLHRAGAWGGETIEPRWVVGFEVVLGAHLPPSMAARSPVSMVSVSMVMDSSER